MRLRRSFLLSKCGHVALPAALLAISMTAVASGPTERVVQLLAHPRDPNVLVVRFGAASQGFLFSRDGGSSFQAMCSESVAPDLEGSERLKQISLREVPSTAAVVMDGAGRISFSQYGSLWSDDGTGCSWSRLPEFDGKFAYGIQADPSDSGAIWAAVTTAVKKVTAETQSRAELMRRDANGVWSVVGPMAELAAGQAVLQGDLLVFAGGAGTRLYGSMNIVDSKVGPLRIVVVSDDKGASWRKYQLPAEQKDLTLLAVDPGDPDRVLAVIPSAGLADAVLLSENGGATFEPYAELRTVAGASFDAQGRLFMADFGDSSSKESQGGLYMAAKLGEPLTKVPGTQYIECVHYHAQANKLYVCNRDRFGVIDPATGTFEELVRLGQVASLLQCPGVDMYALCEEQFNAGPAWCCAGHYPFTPFCGEYDVTTRPDGMRVYCGLAGREYDMQGSTNGVSDGGVDAGSMGGQRDTSDAGAAVDAAQHTGPDGSEPEANPTPRDRSKRGDGCAISAAGRDSQFRFGALALSIAMSAVLAACRRRARTSS